MNKLALSSLLFTPYLYSSSIYIPIDSTIASEIEQMALISDMPTSKMPYSLEMVKSYNEKIKNSNHDLFNTIDKYIAQLEPNAAKERLYVEGSINSQSIDIPNSHGINSSSNYFAQGWYFWNFSNDLKASTQIELREENNEPKLVTNNTYLSYGFDWSQIDLGYKDHYYGQFRNGGMQISNNARNSVSLSISNPKPFEFAKTNYEIFLTKLAKVDGIHSDGQVFEGNPYLLGMHLDFHPISDFEISLDRTFQFGGGPRSSSLSDIWAAFVDPVSKDNTNNECGTDCETGNQQAGIQLKYNFKNFNIYAAYVGEDTVGENYSLGNVSQGFGIYIPKITNQTSMRYEFLDIGTAWYIHHLYDRGYTNYSNVMGNWFGDTMVEGDAPGGTLHYLELINDFYGNKFISKFRFFKPNSSYTSQNYSTYKSAEFEILKKIKTYDTKIKVLIGEDTFANKFSQLAIGFSF